MGEFLPSGEGCGRCNHTRHERDCKTQRFDKTNQDFRSARPKFVLLLPHTRRLVRGTQQNYHPTSPPPTKPTTCKIPRAHFPATSSNFSTPKTNPFPGTKTLVQKTKTPSSLFFFSIHPPPPPPPKTDQARQRQCSSTNTHYFLFFHLLLQGPVPLCQLNVMFRFRIAKANHRPKPIFQATSLQLQSKFQRRNPNLHKSWHTIRIFASHHFMKLNHPRPATTRLFQTPPSPFPSIIHSTVV